METIRDPEYILRFDIEGMAISNPGCWGYTFEEITRHGQKTRYFNFFDQVNETQLDVHYKLGVNYTFRIGALPSAMIIQIEWKAPDSCQLEVLQDVHQKLVERGLYRTRCKDKLNVPHVMILHRRGCEALESFVLELAGLLRSYGIEVKTTLCEQTLVDSEGGIASYMQRNIFQCDYVLILLTEATENNTLMNHRAFEFAITMIQGLAVHSNSYSKYLPIYFTSYYKAFKFFPPFLNASTSYGYRLPHETMRLIARLLRTTNMKQSKERTIKDKNFLNKMKRFTKDVLQYKHTNCIVGKCRKGTHYASTSDLSSVWKSTIRSKWMSTKSTLDQDDDDINGCMDSKGLGTMNNGSIQLAGMHARGENLSNSMNKLNLYSVETDEVLDNEEFYADNIKIDQVKDWRMDSATAERHQIHILPPFYAHYSTSPSSCDDLTRDHYYTGIETFQNLSLNSAGGSVDEHRKFLGSTENEDKESII